MFKRVYSNTREKSKFLAFLVPYKDLIKQCKRLRSEHPKAVHLSYAYRYLNEFEQIVEKIVVMENHEEQVENQLFWLF